MIAVADPIKDTTPEAIRALHNLGLKVAMITGDNQATADAVARTLGIDEVVGEVPTRALERSGLEAPGRLLVELFVESGLCPSKGQARKDLDGGGLYLNNERLTDSAGTATTADLLFGRHLLLRKGRRNYVVLTAR